MDPAVAVAADDEGRRRRWWKRGFDLDFEIARHGWRPPLCVEAFRWRVRELGRHGWCLGGER
jgi:hypothetical protein